MLAVEMLAMFSPAWVQLPADPLAGLSPAWRRWHLCRRFVHQFRLLAQRQRLPPATSAGSGDDGGGWHRVRSSDAPQLGLAAVKHAEREGRRASMAAGFQKAAIAADTRTTTARSATRSTRRAKGRTRQLRK